MEFDLARLQPKERASFALRALYEAAGCRKYHMGRFEEYGCTRKTAVSSPRSRSSRLLIWMAACWPSSRT